MKVTLEVDEAQVPDDDAHFLNDVARHPAVRELEVEHSNDGSKPPVQESSTDEDSVYNGEAAVTTLDKSDLDVEVEFDYPHQQTDEFDTGRSIRPGHELYQYAADLARDRCDHPPHGKWVRTTDSITTKVWEGYDLQVRLSTALWPTVGWMAYVERPDRSEVIPLFNYRMGRQLAFERASEFMSSYVRNKAQQTEATEGQNDA